MTAAEVAQILRVSTTTVYRLQKAGEFRLPLTSAQFERWLATKRRVKQG